MIEKSGEITIRSIADIIRDRIPAHGNRAAIRFDTGDKYETLAYSGYTEKIRAMAAFLKKEAGTQKVIATFTLNRPEWDITALACFYTANILFPLDTKMNDTELLQLLSYNPPLIMLTSRPQQARLQRLLSQAGATTRLITADLYTVFEDLQPAAEMGSGPGLSMSRIIAENYVKELPEPAVLLADSSTVLAHYSTSGTVGASSIVEITHGNITAEVNEAMDIMNLRDNEDFLNIGPYTHIATLVEFLTAKAKGIAVTYFTREADEDDVLENEIKKMKKQGIRIKALMAVPKFWIYIMKEVLEEIKNKKALKNIYGHLINIEKNAKLQDIGAFDKAKLTAVKTLLRDKMGGYFSFGISSSTKLDAGVTEIFSKLGITVLDIYGATEATGIISRNRLHQNKPGSCGRVINMLETRFSNVRNIPGFDAPIGELEIKGPTVMKGYLRDEAKTKERLSADGFFATGDLAYMDKEGFIHLLGRKKELIQWKDGSYIDPMRLSNLLVRSIYIKDALVTRIKDDDFLSVFILPDYARIKKDRDYMEKITAGTGEKQALRPMLEDAIAFAESLAAIPAKLSAEKIYMLDRKLERTPTHKIKFVFELKRLNLESYI